MPDDKSVDIEQRSLYTIASKQSRKSDTIPFRIDFAKEILNETKLETMMYSDGCETEVFLHPYDSESGSDGDGSRDTRKVLKKKLKNFHNVISQIGGKLKYIKSGTTGHTFRGMLTSEDGVAIDYAVKVVAYPRKEKYGDMYDITRPENAELMMIRLLSYFVVKKQTPHIVLPIATFNTSIKPFINLIKEGIVDVENKKYKEFVERYKSGEYYSHVSILISEWANRGDFLDFIRRNNKNFEAIHWKVFFFQIISVLAIIQSKYPAFRHNDFKANNILIHKVMRNKSKMYNYKINNIRYIVPNIGYHVKIWDFDFACIDGLVDNAKVNAEWTTQINISCGKNRYYDLHYFFNTLIKKGFFPEFMTSDRIPEEAKKFVNRVVPEKYQKESEGVVAKRGRILISTEYTTPDQVLKHDPYFEEFRNSSYK